MTIDLHERNERIIEDYGLGLSTTQLAKKYGITQGRICQIFKGEGFQCRPIREASLASELVKEEIARARVRERRLVALYESGASISEIAEAEERSTSTIYKVLVRAGYKPGPRRFPLSDFWLAEGPEKYYLLGLIFADGNISNGGVVSISLRDADFLEEIGGIVGREVHTYIYRAENKPISSLTLGGKNLATYLMRYDLYPRKSNTMKFPGNIPQEYMRDFIRGEFDGDGYISIGDHHHGGARIAFGFSSGSMEFLLALREALLQMGIDNGHIREQKTEWGHVNQLTYEGVFRSLRMRGFLYCSDCLCLGRKRDKFFSIKEPILMISKNGKGYYRHSS